MVFLPVILDGCDAGSGSACRDSGAQAMDRGFRTRVVSRHATGAGNHAAPLPRPGRIAADSSSYAYRFKRRYLLSRHALKRYGIHVSPDGVRATRERCDFGRQVRRGRRGAPLPHRLLQRASPHAFSRLFAPAARAPAPLALRRKTTTRAVGSADSRLTQNAGRFRRFRL